MTDINETPPHSGTGSDDGPWVKEPGSTEEPVNRPVSRLLFPLAGQGLLYDRHSAMEYFESQKLFRIPTAHPLFRGLINRRGSLVPIFDIGMLLGCEASLGGQARVLVLGRGDDSAGLILDATPYRISVMDEQKVAPPPHLTQVFGEHLRECFDTGQQCVAEVDFESFLGDLARAAN